VGMRGQLLRIALLLAAVVAALVATAAAPARVSVQTSAAATSHATFANCRRGYYKNISGHCVHRPAHYSNAPAGARAKCRDGTYSFSQHASGTCSWHGGVAVWIHHP
jgi:hypothetical protein